MTPSAPAQTVVQTPATAPTPPPAFQADASKKPKPKSPFTTFLGSGATPGAAQQATTQKTLLGA